MEGLVTDGRREPIRLPNGSRDYSACGMTNPPGRLGALDEITSSVIILERAHEFRRLRTCRRIVANRFNLARGRG
jgi:hypothetical protein